MKKIIITAGVLELLKYHLLHSDSSLAAVRNGMGLWLNVLVPTLLPFMILTDILIRTGVIKKILMPTWRFWKFFFGITPSGAYALLGGCLCGYPMGAKITSDLYLNQEITLEEAQYLLTFTNHPSPAFVNTYIAAVCLEDKISSGYIFFILYLSSFISMLVFRFFYYKKKKKQCSKKETKKEASISSLPGALMDVSIMNGFETITRLGGYILLFSILADMIRNSWKFNPFWECLLLGLMELTTGSKLLSETSLSYTVKCLCLIPMTAFGGLCITAQTRSLVSKKLSLKPYLLAKICTSAISLIMTLVFVKII